MTTAILDRTSQDTALLTASDGRQWDVYGEATWASVKAEACLIAEHEGLTIEIFNSEMPEA